MWRSVFYPVVFPESIAITTPIRKTDHLCPLLYHNFAILDKFIINKLVGVLRYGSVGVSSSFLRRERRRKVVPVIAAVAAAMAQAGPMAL